MADDELEIRLGASTDVSPSPATPAPSGPGAVSVEVISRVLDEMDAHVAEDTSVEHGGVMVGHHDEAGGTTVITGSVRALGAVSDIASLRFTHETWDHINGVMERDFPGAQMVGWYHSHPHFGIFLSDHDQFIHRNFFALPWQVAYVRDPLLDQRGFFVWDGDEIAPLLEDEDQATTVAAGTDEAPPVPTALDASWTVTTEDVAERTVAALAGKGRSRGAASRPRRWWPIVVGAVAAVLLVGGAIVVASSLLGGDEAPPVDVAVEAPDDELGLLTPAGRGIPLEVVVSGEDEALDGLEVEVSDLEGNGASITTDEGAVVSGVAELTITPPEDTTPDTYNGTVTVRRCEDETEASCEEVATAPIGITVVPAIDVSSGSVPSVEVGACLALPSVGEGGALETDGEVVDCDEPHGVEVIGERTFEQPAGEAYPAFAFDTRPIERPAVADCLGADFSAQVGSEFDATTALRVWVIVPDQVSWDDGVRQALCTVRFDEEVVGSVSGGQTPSPAPDESDGSEGPDEGTGSDEPDAGATGGAETEGSQQGSGGNG